MKPFNNPIFRDFSPRVQVRAIGDDAPNGGGAGCGNVTGYLDSWGTMLLPNSFQDTIPFLSKAGFLCDGHGHATNGYTESSNLGFFTKVFEDAEGLQIEWAYHSKPHAQNARTTLAERLENDKTSGLSIGFFVGNGRTAPVGWDYNPDEDKPDGVDYISVRAQYFEEVLLEVSKPEYLKDNLARAANLNCIYLFCNVHVFEVSQTLVPANEVSLIAEVRSINSKTKTMAKEKPKPEEDEPNQDDTLQACNRAFRALKNEHREHDRTTRDLHKEIEGHLAKLSGNTDDEEDAKEPDGDEPEKKKPEEEKKSRARKLFEGVK